jgi:hypothetical protein
MKNDRFLKLVEDRITRCKNLLFKKGSDYDKVDQDRLSSFKKVAAIANELEIDNFTGHTGSGVANMLFVLKQVRDANLKHSNRPPQNESRTDTLDDMVNYIDLMVANEEDEFEKNSPRKALEITAMFKVNDKGMIDLGDHQYCKPEVLEKAFRKYMDRVEEAAT